MPFHRFVILIAAVIFAAGITIWLLTLGSPGLLVASLPAIGIAALAFRVWGR